MSERPIRIYRAEARAFSLFGSLRAAARDVSASRYVIWRLFLRDFTVQFRQKILGYFWAVIAPLAAIASFVFMAYAGVLRPGTTEVPYPLYVYFGTAYWGMMIATLTTVANGLLGNSELLLRTNVPAIALALAGMANNAYNIVVSTLVFVLVLLISGFTPSPYAVLYPVLMLPMVLLGLGIGLMLAVIGAVARDVTSIVTTMLGFLMYLSPVVYVTNFQQPLLRAIVAYNPLTYLIDMPRELVLMGRTTGWEGFALASLFSLVVLALGIHGFYLIKDKVVERL